MRREITNPQLLDTIRFLKEKAKQHKARIWELAAEQLSKPRRGRAVLNLNHISRASVAQSKVLVPGKVLGDGSLKHPVVVGAFEFSERARTKIEDAGGKCLTIKELVIHNPRGSKVLILR